MSGVLVVSEARQLEATLELIAVGLELKRQGCSPLTVVTFAGDAEALNVPGVDQIVRAAFPVAHHEAHVAAKLLEGVVDELRPALVLTAQSVDAMGFAPAVAARLGLGFASNAMSVEWCDGAPIVRRGVYADRLVSRIDFPGSERVLVMLRSGAADAPAAGGGSATVRPPAVELTPDDALTEHLGFVTTSEAAAGDVDIAAADFLLSIGRGVEDEEDVERFEEIAAKVGATLSVSRPLVDAGWVPPSRQVGQSGKTVKPKVYLALGISGAVQHLAGMRKAGTIIAVNTDPEAPIFTVAHYGAVADLNRVADALPRHFE